MKDTAVLARCNLFAVLGAIPHLLRLDPIAAGGLRLHKQLLITDKTVIIENLNNLDKVPAGLFTFCALPLRYENADGSPIRAVALLEI